MEWLYRTKQSPSTDSRGGTGVDSSQGMSARSVEGKAPSTATLDPEALKIENERLLSELSALQKRIMEGLNRQSARISQRDGQTEASAPPAELLHPGSLGELKDLRLHVLPIGGPETDEKEARDFYHELSTALKQRRGHGKAQGGHGQEGTPSDVPATDEGQTSTEQQVETEGLGTLESRSSEMDGCSEQSQSSSAVPSQTVSEPAVKAHAAGSELYVEMPEGGEGENKDANGDRQLGIVDISNVEWWTLVDKEQVSAELADAFLACAADGSVHEIPSEPDRDLGMEDDEAKLEDCLGGSYHIVDDADLASAVAEYVGLLLKRNPQAKHVPMDEMRKLLEVNLGGKATMAPAGTLARVWGWGQLAYTSYSYAQWAYALYREPAMVKLVATGVWKAARWALIFLM